MGSPYYIVLSPGGHPCLLRRRALGEPRLRLLDGYHRPLGHAQRIICVFTRHIGHDKCVVARIIQMLTR